MPISSLVSDSVLKSKMDAALGDYLSSKIGVLQGALDCKTQTCWTEYPDVTTTVVTGGNSPCRGASTATCPPGYVVVGGGSAYVMSCGCDDKYRFVSVSQPVGKTGWTAIIECAVNRAYAVCALA
jgi:hypothetical protein